MSLSTLQLENAVGELIPHARSPRSSAPQTERQLRRSLTTCILSSRVRYETATAFALQLDRAGLLRSTKTVGLEAMTRQVQAILDQPLLIGGRVVKYRFPRSRALWLSTAFKHIGTQFGTVRTMLQALGQSNEIRSYLVRHVNGLGPKQASMFLRDAGIDLHVAIIDAHVARFMGIVLGVPLAPGALSNLSTYEAQEVHLSDYVRRWGAPLGQADRAIWATMRAASNLQML